MQRSIVFAIVAALSLAVVGAQDAPKVIDVDQNGTIVPMVIETTKQGFAYVFNRASGEPVWPMVERDVPQSDTPGERVQREVHRVDRQGVFIPGQVAGRPHRVVPGLLAATG